MLYVAGIDAHCAPRQAVGAPTSGRPQDTRRSSSLCPTKEEFQACTPCVEHTRTASKPTGACLRRWAHRAQLARVVISCGKQKPSAWAEETKKRGLTRRKRFSTVTEALFRVLNTLSDPFHVQCVPHGQFESKRASKRRGQRSLSVTS